MTDRPGPPIDPDAATSEAPTRYLQWLVRNLAEHFEVEHCFVAECLNEPPTRMRTVAFWSDGRHLDPVTYDLDGTPCCQAIADGGILVRDRVQAAFPNDRDLVDLGAVSYAAASLVDLDGRVLGHLALLARRRLVAGEISFERLKRYTRRAGLELLRLRDRSRLAESEERFRRLAEASFEGILIHRKGVCIDTNDQAPKMLGYTRADLIGQLVSARVEHARRDELQGVLERDEPLEPQIVKVYHRDRSELLLEVRGRPILYDGKPARVTVVRDVTEAHQRVERTQHEQRLEAMGRLAGGIAHDFNNLLTVILGGAEMLRDEPGLRPHAAKAAEQVFEASHRAADLIGQLLAFSRKQPLAPMQLSLNEEVRASRRILRPLLPASIDLVTDLPEPELWVHFDRTQISQVLINLAINARDAMPEGGQLSIAVKRVEFGAREILREGAYVALVVSDTGKGMSSQVRERIFEPFFTTKHEQERYGLGLSTVYGLVRQAGGTIVVRSEPGKGSEFSVYLPQIDPPARAACVAEAELSDRAGKIVVVEDVTEVGELIEEGLGDSGYEVQLFAQPQEALDYVRSASANVDALVTDLVMPGMSGQELAQRVRRVRPELPSSTSLDTHRRARSCNRCCVSRLRSRSFVPRCPNSSRLT